MAVSALWSGKACLDRSKDQVRPFQEREGARTWNRDRWAGKLQGQLGGQPGRHGDSMGRVTRIAGKRATGRGSGGGIDHAEPPRRSCLLSEYASKHRIMETITVSGEAHSTQHRSQKCHVQISTLLPLAVLPKTLTSLWINGDNNDTH